MSSRLLTALAEQYGNFPHWSYQLHADNLAALVEQRPELGEAPSYSTVRRRMKERGWTKKRRPRSPGQYKAAVRLEQREVRSYEAAYVYGLWHLDFHTGSCRVVDGRSDNLLATIYPQDKIKNAEGYRREFAQQDHAVSTSPAKKPIPPMLRKFLTDYAATGLPAAYIPKDEYQQGDNHEQ